jgi:hypothetical protein
MWWLSNRLDASDNGLRRGLRYGPEEDHHHPTRADSTASWPIRLKPIDQLLPVSEPPEHPRNVGLDELQIGLAILGRTDVSMREVSHTAQRLLVHLE